MTEIAKAQRAIHRQEAAEQADLTDLQHLVWELLEDREEVVGFDRLSDSEYGVEMHRGARCFITVTLA